jgi:hypothetical protein
MRRTVAKIFMLMLVIAGSLAVGVGGYLPWDQRAFPWFCGAMLLLLLVGFIDGLLLFRGLLRHLGGREESNQSWTDQKR